MLLYKVCVHITVELGEPLSTCCRKYDKANSGNQRLVVMAKLLPEGATAQEFSVSLVDNPEMP